MSDLFYQLGRKLGHVALPTVRKTRWAWHLLTGSSEESLKAELQLGQTMAQELRRFSTPANRPADLALLQTIGSRLANSLQKRTREFTVELVHTGSANALSLPGGFIFVDTQLFDFCNGQPDELAFILGHEMGHISRRHTVDRLVAQIGIKVISGLVMTRGALGSWWRQNGKELLSKAYSRDQEFQADDFGLRLAWGADYDPTAALRLLQRLSQLRHGSGGMSDYFASHPPEADRIARLQSVLNESP